MCNCTCVPLNPKHSATDLLATILTNSNQKEMFNWSFLPMDSTNWNVLFRFDVLLHPRLFCFVINTADKCEYTRTFCAMDDHVEHSVLTSIKTKTVWIKSLFFQVRKFFKSYSSYTCKSLHI